MKRTLFDSDHELFRSTYRAFLQGEVTPNREQWHRDGIVPREMYRKAGAQGYLLTWADEAYGGLGIQDFRYQQVMCEEDAVWGDTGFFHSLHSRIVAPYIRHFGSEEQRQRFLPGAVTGDIVLAIAMTEPDAGSDLAGMRSRAVEHADHWVLNGAKTYISNGIQADLVLVAAKTSTENPRQIGLFLVEAGMPGFERGRKLEKMGLPSQDTSELFFRDVKLPKANVLGNPAHGFRYLMKSLAEERLLGATQNIASARAAFDITRDFVQQRKAFGQRLADFQNTRFRLGQLSAEIEAAQAFIDHCVMLHNEGELSAESAAAAKLLTSELEGRMVDEGVQLHGGAGYMREYEICRRFLDARISRIYAGSSEIMREIIARSVLDER